MNPQNWDDCEILCQQMMMIIIEPTFHPSTCDKKERKKERKKEWKNERKKETEKETEKERKKEK